MPRTGKIKGMSISLSVTQLRLVRDSEISETVSIVAKLISDL